MDNSRIGVTGAEGKVGRELVRRGCTPLVCDVTKYDEVHESILKSGVDFVIHCAAITDVDFCEKKENMPLAFAVNCKGTENVIRACVELKKKMIFISTDHVFNGKKIFGSYK